MANPFSVAVPNIYDALLAGEQGYKDMRAIQKDNALSAGREAAAQHIMQGGDPQNAIALLLRANDLQGASMVSNMGNNNRDFAFRQQEAQRAQGNADRSYALQLKQAEEKPQYMKDDNGNIVKIDPYGRGASVINPTGAAGPSNPFSYGKMNESESKDAGYANRMFQSEGVLRDPKLMAASQSITDRAADRILPGDIANKFVVSKEYQKYDQAARDFINATLRRESGAAISASEFDNAYKQYLPRPGDDEETLKQKQRNRQATIASIAGGGGKNYKPPFSFDQSGNMVPTGNAAQGVRPQAGGKPIPAELVNEAKAAIANGGKDPAGVKAKLQQHGYDITGLDF